jgi:hypothetical protein
MPFIYLRVERLCLRWLLLFTLTSCSTVIPPDEESRRLDETVNLVRDVKAFGKTLGIEPTEALSRTSREAPPLSMMWLWMQRVGTLALRGPIDVRMAIGFAMAKEQLKLEQVYRVNGYSVYYRQGNEFADARSLATIGFADTGIVRRVKVILHEDLHGDKNFDLAWDIEEAIVTPLGSLAAAEFFKHKGDEENLKRALASIDEERKFAQELAELVKEGEWLFKTVPAEQANQMILALMPSFPLYHRQFQRQIAGQHPPTVLEAKLSHDLAYFRYYDQIVSLEKSAGSLKRFIDDLKKLPPNTTHETLEKYLGDLGAKYGASLR